MKNKGALDRKFILAREKYKKARKWMVICKDDFTAITNEMLAGVYEVESDRDGSVKSQEWEM